jgi:hypothetical protein
MISKLVPLLNGLTSLITTIDCILVDVAGVLLLILISTNMKLKGSYLKSRKVIRYAYSSSW